MTACMNEERDLFGVPFFMSECGHFQKVWSEMWSKVTEAA